MNIEQNIQRIERELEQLKAAHEASKPRFVIEARPRPMPRTDAHLSYATRGTANYSVVDSTKTFHEPGRVCATFFTHNDARTAEEHARQYADMLNAGV